MLKDRSDQSKSGAKMKSDRVTIFCATVCSRFAAKSANCYRNQLKYFDSSICSWRDVAMSKNDLTLPSDYADLSKALVNYLPNVSQAPDGNPHQSSRPGSSGRGSCQMSTHVRSSRLREGLLTDSVFRVHATILNKQENQSIFYVLCVSR